MGASHPCKEGAENSWPTKRSTENSPLSLDEFLKTQKLPTFIATIEEVANRPDPTL